LVLLVETPQKKEVGNKINVEEKSTDRVSISSSGPIQMESSKLMQKIPNWKNGKVK
jgi:hypothetical protein